MICSRTLGAGWVCIFWQNGASGTLIDGLQHVDNLVHHGCKNCGSDPTEPGNNVKQGELTSNFVTHPCCVPGPIDETCYCNK